MTNNENIHISYMVRHDVLLVRPQHGGWILQAGKYKHLHLVLAWKLDIVISSQVQVAGWWGPSSASVSLQLGTIYNIVFGQVFLKESTIIS